MAEEPTNPVSRRSERIGRYEILAHIATGGMGAVYKARDTDLDRIVALKVLPHDLANRPEMLNRFRKEARAAAKLRHDNIVAIFDVGEANGTYYLAMEFVEGTDLAAYIKRKGKLSPDRARQILIQAARALEHAHEQGIVHRDIKPSNFLLAKGKDNRAIVKLADMGLAREIAEDESAHRLTRHGTTVGTVDYMSPEQARDSGKADIRSDIYSLGCTLYHMLAGDPPFPKGSLTERLMQHVQDEPKDIRQLNPAVPDSLALVLTRMLAKSPDDRYQTPAELRNDLENPDRLAGRTPAMSDDIDLFQAFETAQASTPSEREQDTGTVSAKTPPPMTPTAPVTPLPAPPPPVEEPEDDASSYGVTQEPGHDNRAFQPVAPRRPTPKPKPKSSPADRNKIPPLKAPAAKPGRIRPRDEEPDEDDAPPPPRRDEPRKSSGGASTPPVGLIAAGAVIALVLIVVVIGLSGRTQRDTTKDDKKTVQTVTPIAPPRDLGQERAAVDTDPAHMGPGALELPVLPGAAIDRAALKAEFYGPFAVFPAPTGPKIVRLSRTAPLATGACRSLADALALTATDAVAIIEIHDQGPIYVPALPAVQKRRLVLRAATGFRPLLAWEAPAPRSGRGEYFSLLGGELILENLDLVAHAPDSGGEPPSVMFRLRQAGFHARGCTFSVTGKYPRGLTLVRLEGGEAGEAARPATQCRLQRCYARGTDLVGLAFDDVPAEVLIEDSLLVSNRGPLMQGRSRDDDTTTFRLVRSTLVSGQDLLTWRSVNNQGGRPQLRGLVLDSILARSDPASAKGDLIRLEDGADARRLSWRVVGGVYAGWRRLLASAGEPIAGADLESWHTQFFYREHDRALGETWPTTPIARPDELPAATFMPYGAPVTFAARSASAAIGCAVGALPPAAADWVQRVYERRPVPVATGPDASGVPPIPTAADGLYAGEKVDLTNVADVGAHLLGLMQDKKLAPRIVFQLSGTGPRPMSPLYLRGHDLMIYVAPSKAQNQPLVFELNQRAAAGFNALIEIEDGTLDLRGVRIRYPNEPLAAMMPYLVRVRNGDLRLTRCQLLGPLSRAPQAFQALVAFEGAGAEATRPTKLSVRDSLLLSGKALLHVGGAGAQVSARNNIGMALGTGAILIDAPTRLGRAGGIVCGLDQNTWAVRQGFLALRPGAEYPTSGDAVVVQASGNYFVDPFGEQPGQSAMLRAQEPALARGLLLWQGRNNAFDQRLHSYFAPLGATQVEKQTLKDWLPLWGPAGEQEPLQVGPAGPPRLVAITPDAPQLERLAVPRDPRFDPNQPPGAKLRHTTDASMRFALLGDHPDGLDMARALVASGRHELTAYSGPALGVAELQRRGLQTQPVGDLEEVLADPAIGAVIVAGGPATRAGQLRRALQSERHVLCVHPADPRPDLAYEAAMLQADTGFVLLPLLPEALHPGMRRLAELARADSPRLIEIERWSVEEVLVDGSTEAERPGLPGWDVLRLLGGEIAEVAVLARTEELENGAPVLLSGRSTSGSLLQVTLLPNQAESRYRVALVTAAGRVTLAFPHGWPGPASLAYTGVDGALHHESWEALDPWAPLVEAFEGAVADVGRRRAAPGRVATTSLAQPEAELGWQDEVRALELDDAARRSVERRRSSTLEHVEATEEASFKGTMTLVGCGLIWLGLVLLIGSVWLPWLAWAIVPTFAVFLLLQVFRWVVPAPAEAGIEKRSEPPVGGAGGSRGSVDRGEFEERR